MRRLPIALLTAILVVLAGLPLLPARAQAGAYVETFDGNPAGPTEFQKLGWDVARHERNDASAGVDIFKNPHPMQAGHGSDCSAPPATHPLTTYEQMVFQCKDHVMTAINGDAYGMIALTPDHMADWSAGEAVIRWDVSTLVYGTTGRDFWDVWITPYEDNIQLPFDLGDVDLQGPPKRAVRVSLGSNNGQNGIRPTIYKNYQPTSDFRDFSSDYNWYTGYNSFLTPSATRRDTFELRLSRTHLSICMPAYSFCWASKSIGALDFTRGVVQFAQHSYTPEKDCDHGSCSASTYHWDNVSISPAVPYTIIRGSPRFVEQPTQAITLASPAPAGASFRFSAIGSAIQTSYDGGATWQAATRAPQGLNNDGHFASYATPIPAGVSSVRLRGGNWQGSFSWFAKDFSVFSQTTPGGPVATATPTNTPLPATATIQAATATTQAAATATLQAATSTAIAATVTAIPPSATALPTATPIPGGPTRLDWNGSRTFWVGANAPWYEWGADIGAGGIQRNSAAINAGFASARAAGVRIIRWWIFPGQPWQITRDAAGKPTGLNPAVYTDMDALVALAAANDLALQPVLFSSFWEAMPVSWLADTSHRDALGTALAPLFARYSGNPTIAAWEVVNEPEWQIWGGNVDAGQAQELVRTLAWTVRNNSPNHHVTVGSAHLDGLPIWRGLGLTHYSAHWYDPMASGGWCARCRTYEDIQVQYGLDGPLTIGEFYAPSSVDAQQRWQDWYDKGFAGAFAWSLFASRTGDGFTVSLPAVTAFSAGKPDLGPRLGSAPPATSTTVPATSTPVASTNTPVPPTNTPQAATATPTAIPDGRVCRVQWDHDGNAGTGLRVLYTGVTSNGQCVRP